MRTFILMLAILVVLTGCEHRGQGYDTNAAEAPRGDSKRKNSQTNEEAGMDTTLSNPVARRDSGSDQVDSSTLTKPEGKTTPSRQSSDHPFIMQAAEAGLTEVKLGKLAIENGRSSEIKDFAEAMVKDHTAANEELKKLVEGRGIELPADCSKCGGKFEELKALKGKRFDDKYAELMVADHKEAVALFKKETKTGGDPAVAKWAQEKVPTLEHHLSMAESLDKKGKKEKKEKNSK
jgi:putative membrane protein